MNFRFMWLKMIKLLQVILTIKKCHVLLKPKDLKKRIKTRDILCNRRDNKSNRFNNDGVSKLHFVSQKIQMKKMLIFFTNFHVLKYLHKRQQKIDNEKNVKIKLHQIL